MPYLLLFIGEIVGVLCMNAKVPGVILVLGLLLLLVYKLLIRVFPYICWVIPLLVGLVTGYIIGINLLLPPPVLGEECEGYIVKVYIRTVSVKVDTCSASNRIRGVFYVSCVKGNCPDVYNRVQVIVTSSERFGRFTGKGVIAKNELKESSSFRRSYFEVFKAGDRVKKSYYCWLKQDLPNEQSALVSSMLFGDVELPESLVEKMKGVGLLHIVAISGINIAYLQSLVRVIFSKLRYKWRTFVETMILIVLFFIVGEAVSLIRALIMSFLGIFTRMVGIKPTEWVFFAGLAMVLVLDPHYLWDAGFLLVSGACVGIYLGGKVLKKYLKPGLIREFMQGVVVWICVMPVQFMIFGNITAVGVFLSFLLSPLVEVMTIIGYVSTIGRYLPVASKFFRIVLGVASTLILLVINLFHG